MDFNALASCVRQALTDMSSAITRTVTPEHEVLTNASKTYDNFRSLTFTVAEGVADVTYGQTTGLPAGQTAPTPVRFPITGANTPINGAGVNALPALIKGPITINAAAAGATAGKVYVTVMR